MENGESALSKDATSDEVSKSNSPFSTTATQSIMARTSSNRGRVGPFATFFGERAGLRSSSSRPKKRFLVVSLDGGSGRMGKER